MSNERIYRIRILGGFRDGMVWPEYIPHNTVIDVPATTYNKMKNSGAEFEDLGWFPPKPTRVEEDGVCTVVKSDGTRCSLKAQANGQCHIHNRGR